MGAMSALLIGDVARMTGLPPATIRYYEQIGLLSAPTRSDAGYRRFGNQAVAELVFIKKAQGLGFSLDEVRGILQLSRRGQAPCAHVLELARQHLKTVDERIHELAAFRDALASDIARWQRQRPSFRDGVCQMITGVADRVPPPELDTKRRPSRSARGVKV